MDNKPRVENLRREDIHQKIFYQSSVILEIGPGAGRWTEYLLEKCDQMFSVDISETSVRECERRFSGYPNAKFEMGNGHDLSSISTGSVDAVWSFDVFVHINKPQFKSYMVEFPRIKPGGVGTPSNTARRAARPAVGAAISGIRM